MGSKWKNLKRLAAFWNKLVFVPSLEGMEALEQLQMHGNLLSELQLGRLPNIRGTQIIFFFGGGVH